MCIRQLIPDPARLMAQLHTAPGEFPEPLDQWDGFGDECCEYLGTLEGVNNLIAKPTYLGIDWMRQWGPVSEQTLNLHQTALTFKNFRSLALLPQYIRDSYQSLSDLCCDSSEEEPYVSKIKEAAFDLFFTIHPTVEVIEGLQASRVIHLSQGTMATLGHWNAASLLAYNVYSAHLSIGAIGFAFEAINQENPLEDIDQTQENFEIRKEMAPTVIALNLIELAKQVSYIAMTAIPLIAAFFVGVIANPALWILVASTSALVFTIIAEFASRAFNPNHSGIIQLPELGDAGVPKNWDWANKSVSGSGTESEESEHDERAVAAN